MMQMHHVLKSQSIESLGPLIDMIIHYVISSIKMYNEKPMGGLGPPRAFRDSCNIVYREKEAS